MLNKKNIDYVHTLRIGFVPKYFCFVMTSPHNLWNVPELIVPELFPERNSYSSPETSNMAFNMVSTAGKTNSINAKNNQSGRKNMTLIGQEKKKNFTGKFLLFHFLFLFQFVHILRKLFRNRFAPLFWVGRNYSDLCCGKHYSSMDAKRIRNKNLLGTACIRKM